MNAICLQVWVAEASRHHGKLTYEWLLDTAQQMGVTGGMAFRALAGFDRHGHHDAGFFELAGDQQVVVMFFTESALADQLLHAITTAGLKLPWARQQAELGVTG